MNERLGNRIKELRNAIGLTQGELAEMAGVERGDIISLESGIFAALDNEALCRIANATEIDGKKYVSLQDFRNKPFILGYPGKESRKVSDRLFRQEKGDGEHHG